MTIVKEAKELSQLIYARLAEEALAKSKAMRTFRDDKAEGGNTGWKSKAMGSDPEGPNPLSRSNLGGGGQGHPGAGANLYQRHHGSGLGREGSNGPHSKFKDRSANELSHLGLGLPGPLHERRKSGGGPLGLAGFGGGRGGKGK